jgi:hypothetical protein
MALTPRIPAIGTETVSFLNRDHIISVTIHDDEIVVLTTAGTRITMPASPETIAKFADELAHDINSNFVSIAAAAFSAS